MQAVARDYSIGILFGGSVAVLAIGLIQFFNFHQFVGLNQTRSIVMMATGGAGAIAASILSCYLCGQKPQPTANRN